MQETCKMGFIRRMYGRCQVGTNNIQDSGGHRTSGFLRIGLEKRATVRGAMGEMLKDGLLRMLQYFHNPELVGSLLLVYVIVSLTAC